jgi:hypothetical protein
MSCCVSDLGGTIVPLAAQKGTAMIFNSLIKDARAHLAKRKRYNQLVGEINSLTDRDLADMNGNRSEMLHHARKQIFG